MLGIAKRHSVVENSGRIQPVAGRYMVFLACNAGKNGNAVRDERGFLVGWQREGSEGKNVDEKKGFGYFSQGMLCGV
jgi:hypothetical protein